MTDNKVQATDKNEIYWKILNAAIALDIKKGHLKWSITNIATISKVSRTLIYYYFGKSKENILLEAIKLFGQELSGNTATRTTAWAAGDLASTFCASRALLARAPDIRVFYFLRRNEQTILGSAILDFEESFKQKISSFFPGLSHTEVDALFALFLGIVWAPELSDDAVMKSVSLILSGVKAQHL
ncbi:TetR/AcrR family transcriptional regulator [Bacteriovorax sp. PP10]|uniref:TetR/AcrR family transcriptional regulator n=1 Tax=Bacteriovorax antarcticus TaxID=3088717 RepID=A0ABU5VSJ5_9BACT|nr:TetR/AcrR family transcriptional regulator [Bacteriovorax sp. PP10]MEA9356035.1 TetR/AcrR family transcriptional regulator [Bacteriovorax sp. PP10]